LAFNILVKAFSFILSILLFSNTQVSFRAKIEAQKTFGANTFSAPVQKNDMIKKYSQKVFYNLLFY